MSKPIIANAGESSGPEGGPTSAKERDILIYERGVADGERLSEAMWTALKNLVIDVATASADLGHCVSCGTTQANEHDPNCSQQVAAYQAEVYRQRRAR